jgi:hypothetical protein
VELGLQFLSIYLWGGAGRYWGFGAEESVANRNAIRLPARKVYPVAPAIIGRVVSRGMGVSHRMSPTRIRCVTFQLSIPIRGGRATMRY